MYVLPLFPATGLLLALPMTRLVLVFILLIDLTGCGISNLFGRSSDPAAAASHSNDSQVAGNLPANISPVLSSAEQPSLFFRVMLMDVNKNQVIENGEAIIAEAEVSNPGPRIARDVSIRISGTPILAQQFPPSISVGDLQPGETKRVEVTGRGPSIDAVQQAELLFSLEATSFIAAPPNQKQFLVTLYPE
ncbi:MAG: hypothetical protein C4294_15455, partial [Nitrospiraceae bacterium]